MFGHHHSRGDPADRTRGCGVRGMRHGHRFGGDWDPRGHRGGGRRERPFEQGDLKLVVLDLIAQQPRHGYEIIKAIEDAMEGGYSPSPGVIYPTLTLLEETGLVASDPQGAKKLYSLTPQGHAYLEAEASAVAAARSRMEEARRRFGPRPAGEIARAMQNLGAALAVRMSRGPLSTEELRAVTDALDAAAKAVERS